MRRADLSESLPSDISLSLGPCLYRTDEVDLTTVTSACTLHFRRIDDWSSYLANFAAESPAQTSTTNGHATPAHGGQPDHHRTSM